jgi:hypothetical protein
MRTRMLSIPHDELLKSVARRIVDWHMLRLVKLWQKAPIEERDEPEVVGALSKRRFGLEQDITCLQVFSPYSFDPVGCQVTGALPGLH